MENTFLYDHEKVVLVPLKGVREGPVHFYRYDHFHGAEMSFIAHWHSEFEIIYVMDQYLDFVVDGQFFHLLPGQALFVHRDVIHGLANMKQDYGRYAALLFGEDFPFPDPQSYVYQTYYVPFLTGKKRFSGHITGESEEERALLASVRELIALSEDITTNILALQIRLLKLFDLLYHHALPSAVFSDASKRDVISGALYYINQNFSENLSVEDISRFLYIHPDYFRRVFKNALGISPKEYILSLRIRYAINEMTAHPEKPLSDVAVQAGFADINYFSRLFKAKVGVSPSAYKKSRPAGESLPEKQPPV